MTTGDIDHLDLVVGSFGDNQLSAFPERKYLVWDGGKGDSLNKNVGLAVDDSNLSLRSGRNENVVGWIAPLRVPSSRKQQLSSGNGEQCSPMHFVFPQRVSPSADGQIMIRVTPSSVNGVTRRSVQNRTVRMAGFGTGRERRSTLEAANPQSHHTSSKFTIAPTLRRHLAGTS